MTNSKVTRQRDLRDSTSIWSVTPHISVITRKSVASRDYDVVVVGAGISGALVANALADGKRSILIVDRRKPVTGSTMASTAMIQHEVDVPLFELTRAIGRSNAERAWLRSGKAVEDLIKLAGDLDIVCSMERKKTLFLAGDEYGSRALRMEADARKQAGLEAEFLQSDEVISRFNIDRTAAIVSDISASANPAQLTAGVLRSVRQRNTEIVECLEITDVREGGDQVFLALSNGKLISARHVVFCTGYEFLDALAHETHDIISTWAIATKPGITKPDWLSDYLVWEGSDPYLYLRSTSDGRMIIGGEDEKSDQAYKSPEKLRKKAKIIVEKASDALNTRIGKPEFSWAAAFGTTPTGLPFIDTVPGMKSTYAVMGFGGNGITFSQIAADVIGAAINGEPDGDADLFAFSRS